MTNEAERDGVHKVFVSYSSHDRASAEAICAALERDGMRCWIAPRDAAPGVSYASDLVEAITQSQSVVVVFSRASNGSEAVLNELEIAANRGIPVVPVRIENVEPEGAAEFYLRRRHWLDAFDNFEASLQSIAPAVRAVRALRTTVRQPASRTRQRNLPHQGTSFVGRGEDVANITELLAAGPLLTIVGPGGVGKTRSALQVVMDIEDPGDGAWFVDLAPLVGPGLIANTILAALGAAARGTKDALAEVVDVLRDRRAVLILDNCEHVVGECSQVVDAILRGAPNVTIVATSREALNVRGERIYRLRPLDGSSSVRLFSERAHAVNPLFELTPENAATVEAICARLDGLALAIELAAARIRVISVQELLRRLSERFRVLTGGSRTALPHQQTMRAMIDWSYDVLSEDERALFRRIAAFAGSFTLEAVTDVAGFGTIDSWETLDLLSKLVDKSLVTAEIDDRGQRYHMLQSIHDYAHERLDDHHERAEAARRHADFFRTFMGDSYREWDVAPAPDWLARTKAELDNVRAALTWTIQHAQNPQLGAQIAASSVPLYLRTALLSEGIQWCEAALALPDIDEPTAARLNYGLSMLINNRGDIDRALAYAERAVTYYRTTDEGRPRIRALSQQAQQLARTGTHASAMELASEAIDAARAFDDRRLLAATLQRCALVYPPADIEIAREQFAESVEHFRALARDDETARALEWWAVAESHAGCFVRAIELAREAADLGGPSDRLHRQNIVASCALAVDDRETAADAARDTLALAQAAHHPMMLAYATAYAAALFSDSDPERSATLLGYAEAKLADLGAKPDLTDTLRTERLERILLERLGEGRTHALRAEGARWSEARALETAALL